MKIFFPVVKYKKIMIVFSLATHFNPELDQIDVKVDFFMVSLMQQMFRGSLYGFMQS